MNPITYILCKLAAACMCIACFVTAAFDACYSERSDLEAGVKRN